MARVKNDYLMRRMAHPSYYDNHHQQYEKQSHFFTRKFIAEGLKESF